MDRNNGTVINCNSNFAVALRKESVDRNDFPVVPAELTTLSLSARRAWIEITGRSVQFHLFAVALRKESVDRNFQVCIVTGRLLQSLSARRAWIEILNAAILRLWAWSLSARRAWIEIGPLVVAPVLAVVALRKESVDRNA